MLGACNLQDESATNTDETSTAPQVISEAIRSQPAPPVNLLQNASFEVFDVNLQPKHWVAPEKPLIVTDPRSARTGKVAVGGTPSSYFTTVVEVAGGQRYTLGHYTRSEKLGAARLQINWIGSDGSQQPSIDVVSTTPRWRWNKLSVTAPANATRAIIYLTPHEESEVWFDDVWFAQGTRVPDPATPPQQRP